ncbi:MAG: glycosyltransferase family 2 protein, partial [Flavobacteriaceae bacterium]|nr:glycosyltransferase family 2 protein [Flavobacteriaceae bacterium]
MRLSLIIPLFNEEDSLIELNKAIIKVVSSMKIKYEIIYVDDGSTDNSWNIITQLCKSSTNLKGIKFFRNYGKSQALCAGFDLAKGEVVITMDADLQDDPNEIPSMFNKIFNENFDLVSGWKKKRFDSVLFKNIPSKIFNFAARLTSGIKLNDFNCGLKAFKAEVVKNIEVYGEMHRYIPVLAKNEGFNRIGQKIVKHSPRKYGKTKFGPSRFIHGFLDLITIWFISKFGKRPMHLFGRIGFLMLLIGFLFA